MKASDHFTYWHFIAIITVVLTGAAIQVFSQGPFKIPEAPIQVEYVHDDYAHVIDLFKDNLKGGHDIGSGVAAYVDGELVLDIQGGWQDVESRVPYTKDTLNMVYSSTKMLTAIVVAQFVDKGVLSYDEKIATYWPEFAQGNKENVTLGNLLRHEAGVGCLDHIITLAEVQDPEQLSTLLATQPHNFNGNLQRSYHGLTGGWYVNEILKRTANWTVDQVAASYMNDYGIEWRLKPYEPEFDHRITRFHLVPQHYEIYNMIRNGVGFARYMWTMMKDKTKVMSRTMGMPAPDGAGPEHVTDKKYRQVEMPSISGYTNARSIAKLAAMMANGGKAIVSGEPDLLSKDTYALASEPMDPAFDLVLQMPVHMQRGGFPIFEHLDIDGITFNGWAGYGGSAFFWNQEHKIGFGFASNAIIRPMSPDFRSIALLEAIVKQARLSHGQGD
ncbi:beta-lactamase/transpeptidase-like protein [Lichtheimia hyalospora FSU 10163]|nr:beta-lactamase/transpeptidase-like protein [Lichtheimia hyalospora FSU 10163]